MLKHCLILSEVLKVIKPCFYTWCPDWVYFFAPAAEVEGGELGRVEEHPRSSSLGGLQGVPGAAARPAEQERLRSRDDRRSGLHTHTAAGRSRRERTESVAKMPLRPDDLRRCTSRARMHLVWSLLVFDFKLWKCAPLKKLWSRTDG